MSQKWDIRFLLMAKMVSDWSKDPSSKCGAVVVRPDKTVASIGFNGFPKAMPDKLEYYRNREEKYSRIVHAEKNAVLHCKENMQGFTLYTYPMAPCDRCCVDILQAGITGFVFPEMPEDKKERWHEVMARSERYIEECGAAWERVPVSDITPENLTQVAEDENRCPVNDVHSYPIVSSPFFNKTYFYRCKLEKNHSEKCQLKAEKIWVQGPENNYSGQWRNL